MASLDEKVKGSIFKDVNTADLIKFGIIPEFIGRFPVTAALEELSEEELKNYSLFNDNAFIKKVLKNIPQESKKFFDEIKQIRIFPVFVTDHFFEIKKNNHG